MFRGIRRRISPATVLSVVALVFAMTGGAYAAKGILITSIKQIKPSVVKQLRGQAGAHGPAGPAGLAGTAGTAGSAGAAGKEGSAGKEGTKGEKGEKGDNGAQGNPWVPDNVLPSGATETGVWGLSRLATTPGLGQVHIPVSFTIPLVAPLPGDSHPEPPRAEDSHVILVEEGETGKTGCSGGTAEEPVADPGYLCVYVAFGENLPAEAFRIVNVGTGEEGAGTTGADLQGIHLEEGSEARGVWVLHAE
jgi:hypothetical protein